MRETEENKKKQTERAEMRKVEARSRVIAATMGGESSDD